MNLFIIEIYCQYHKKNEYKRIGEIKTSNISYLPIGSHLIMSDTEVEIISYLVPTNNGGNTKMLVKAIDEQDENCYKNKIYRF